MPRPPTYSRDTEWDASELPVHAFALSQYRQCRQPCTNPPVLAVLGWCWLTYTMWADAGIIYEVHTMHYANIDHAMDNNCAPICPMMLSLIRVIRLVRETTLPCLYWADSGWYRPANLMLVLNEVYTMHYANIDHAMDNDPPPICPVLLSLIRVTRVVRQNTYVVWIWLMLADLYQMTQCWW